MTEQPTCNALLVYPEFPPSYWGLNLVPELDPEVLVRGYRRVLG